MLSSVVAERLQTAIGDVEMTERVYPVIIHRFSRRPDSESMTPIELDLVLALVPVPDGNDPERSLTLAQPAGTVVIAEETDVSATLNSLKISTLPFSLNVASYHRTEWQVVNLAL